MLDPLKIALNYLKFRPRSIFEVTEKLKAKKISDKEIKKTIDVLEKNKLLDDKKFAKMWVADRNLLKPEGSYLLKLELKKLGISEDIIEAVLIGQNEEKLAKTALDSKSRLNDADFHKKANFLQRRGFKIETIYKILRKSQ
ncbi:MAG: regulatory protein RecX [Patescibacteria group bacterium]